MQNTNNVVSIDRMNFLEEQVLKQEEQIVALQQVVGQLISGLFNNDTQSNMQNLHYDVMYGRPTTGKVIDEEHTPTTLQGDLLQSRVEKLESACALSCLMVAGDNTGLRLGVSSDPVLPCIVEDSWDSWENDNYFKTDNLLKSGVGKDPYDDDDSDYCEEDANEDPDNDEDANEDPDNDEDNKYWRR